MLNNFWCWFLSLVLLATTAITLDSSQASSEVVYLRAEYYEELVPYQIKIEKFGKGIMHVIESKFSMMAPKHWSLYVQAKDKFDMDREIRKGEILIGYGDFWDPAIPTELLIYEMHAGLNIYIAIDRPDGKHHRFLRFKLPDGQVIPRSGFIKAQTRLVTYK